MISGNTKVYSVIGNPVKHSKSPNMHNAAFQALNINACYVPLEPRNEDLKNICNLIKFGIISGSNVTIPFKESVMEYVDVLTDEASMIGSVNTLYSRDGKLVGNNTDGLGFKKSLFSDLGFAPLEKSAIILGAGGVAPSIIYSLMGMGCKKINLSNRTIEKAMNIKRKLQKLPT